MDALTKRYLVRAQKCGSTAKTLRGAIAWFRRHGGILPPATRAGEYDLTARCERAGVGAYRHVYLTAQQVAWVRAEAGVPGDSVSVCLLGGRLAQSAPTVTGRGYWFRWRGKWKSAPGSYQPSTRHVTVGGEWLRDHLPANIQRYRGPGGGLYDLYPTYLRGRWSAHRCHLKEGPCWLVFRAKQEAYHSRAASPQDAVREAKAARIQRLATPRAVAHVDLTRVWVTREDSLRAGNCEVGTDSFARPLLARLGATGEVGAVRADVLVAAHPQNSRVSRSVHAAILRSQ